MNASVACSGSTTAMLPDSWPPEFRHSTGDAASPKPGQVLTATSVAGSDKNAHVTGIFNSRINVQAGNQYSPYRTAHDHVINGTCRMAQRLANRSKGVRKTEERR